MEMDGLVYSEDNNTYCLNFSDSVIKEVRAVRIFGILIILLLLVPTLILQLFFIYRYKSTFLRRQFLYATVVVTLISTLFIVFSNIVDAACPLLNPLIIVTNLNRYLWYVDMLQITILRLLLLYKSFKQIATGTTQRQQTHSNNRWQEVMIVCIKVELALGAQFVATLMTYSFFSTKVELYLMRPLVSLQAVNILSGLTCIVMLVVWFCILWKRKLLKNKVKFVFTEMAHILFVIVVFLFWNISTLFSAFEYGTVVYILFATIRTLIMPAYFGVYFIMTLPNLRMKTTTKAHVRATNRHTNPPSTRVSLPTDTAEHAPNFLSPSTAEPSEVFSMNQALQELETIVYDIVIVIVT